MHFPSTSISKEVMRGRKGSWWSLDFTILADHAIFGNLSKQYRVSLALCRCSLRCPEANFLYHPHSSLLTPHSFYLLPDLRWPDV